MFAHLTKICLSGILTLGLIISALFTASIPVQALELESQPYFIKQIEKDRVLAVSPNFRGDLSQASLFPSLAEIDQSYDIRAIRAVNAEKLNGKLVPGLIVYVKAKSLDINPQSTVATNP